MKYLLSEEEYLALKKIIPEKEEAYKNTINTLCTLAAAFIPIRYWDNNDMIPWGCPYYKHKPIEHVKFSLPKKVTTGEGVYMEYCDECPVSKYCSQRKHYSK